MADKKTRWSTNEKIRIVLQTFNPETKVAELCREHNLSPKTPRTIHVNGADKKAVQNWNFCFNKRVSRLEKDRFTTVVDDEAIFIHDMRGRLPHICSKVAPRHDRKERNSANPWRFSP